LLGPVFDGHSHSKVNCSLGMVSLERLEPMSTGAKSLNYFLPKICRAITRRWISLVPSPIVHNFTSR
jgi:hypothetical protein